MAKKRKIVKVKRIVKRRRYTDEEIFNLAEHNPAYRREANTRLDRAVKKEVKSSRGLKRVWFRVLGHK